MLKVVLDPEEVQHSDEICVLNTPQHFSEGTAEYMNHSNSKHDFVSFAEEQGLSLADQYTLDQDEIVDEPPINENEPDATSHELDAASADGQLIAETESVDTTEKEQISVPDVPDVPSAPPISDTTSDQSESSENITASDEVSDGTPDTSHDDSQEESHPLGDSSLMPEAAEDISVTKEDNAQPVAEPTPSVEDDDREALMQQMATLRHNAEQESQKIISAAHQEAAALIQQARDEQETLRAQATSDGKRVGYEQGKADGQKAVESVIGRLRIIVGKVLDQRRAIVSRVESQIVDMILLIANKVIKTVTAETRGVVVENVRQALELLASEQHITIRVNPADLKLSEAELQKLTIEMEKDRNIAFHADGTIEKGGCLIETELGDIDARIASQLSELEQQLRTTSIPHRGKSNFHGR